MFSMLTFEIRAFFSTIEANIADQIFPTLPQQTMTLGGQEIKELLHDMTRPRSPDGPVTIFLEEIDLAW